MAREKNQNREEKSNTATENTETTRFDRLIMNMRLPEIKQANL